MGSSYFPRINTSLSYSITGPTGPTGDQGETGPTGYGPTGHTGFSIDTIGILGSKVLRTILTNPDPLAPLGTQTFTTKNLIRGVTGDTYLLLGFTSGTGYTLFYGKSGDTYFKFRTITGKTSTSGRAEVIVGLSGNDIYIDYVNSSSGFTIGITGSDTINTFVGYSGSTLISISKTKYGTASIFATKNVFEKARGLGFTGSTFVSTGITCNYIGGGTLSYVDSEGYVGYTACKILYIDPDCIANNSTDLQIRSKVFIADMKNNISRVVLGNSSHPSNVTSFTLVMENALNGPTAIGQGEKRFKLAALTGGVMWPFDLEPCFCGSSGTNVYHFFNIGGYTWYGSVGSMTDTSKFFGCPNGRIIEGITEGYGACCYDDGTVGGTCEYLTKRECDAKGNTYPSFWHNSIICGSSPCAKTGGCCLNFISDFKKAENSFLCLDGITCINCITGRVYDSEGKAYNASSFTYLGNGVTCTSSNCNGA